VAARRQYAHPTPARPPPSSFFPID